ncbi:AraC family transcriptional regulator [Foetidibacter luteolus]|uniref:AraC family transcriptional regulator n=1 Tax=Foetidibacter luteolus TaxID=2608880 RepID=UPI00129AE1AC|nr:AraC family transcriptional regulator [Foetidibacter luteolus]
MKKPVYNIATHLQTRRLEQEVENRTAYTLDNAELSIYETLHPAWNVALQFDIPVLAGMISGKKIMHINDKPAFEFLPGQSLVLPPKKTCFIDFPEAGAGTPTQCLTLAVAPETVSAFCGRLNDKAPLADTATGWNYNGEDYVCSNDKIINQLLARLVFIFTENNQAKDFFANLVLQELLIRLMQTKAKQALMVNYKQHASSNRMAYVIEFINSNLQDNITIKTLSQKAYMSEPHFFRCFKQQFGITPVDYINEQRIKNARMMLHAADRTITEISFSCGFNNLNYFLKLFKRYTGLTPAQYRKSLFA